MLDNFVPWLEPFHFLRPWWLLALIPAGALVLALWFRVTRAGQWQQWVAPHLLTYLIEDGQGKRRRWPLLAVLGMWIITVIALAGPAWQKLPEPVQKGGSALVVVWDMSPSMAAQDIKPSRLTRSRLKLIDLLRSRREGVTGLVAYAGEAHVITPLTDDTDTIISLLPALTPGNMPMAGSNTEMALEMAHGLLDDAGIASGQVLLITDGIAPEAYDTLARIRRGGGHQLTIWGIGTTEGAPIPLSRGGFAKDRSGNMVIAKFDEDAMQDFAAEIDAYYVPFLQSDEDIETLDRLFTGPGDNLRQSNRIFDNWYEHGSWLLLLILPLVALTFRRGWLLCLAFVTLPLALPQPAHAAAWADLWKTPDQQGQEALAQQEAERAAELFDDPSWRGTALYRAGNYDAALEAFRQSDALRDLYNQGNSLMQLGDFQAAIDAYQQVLEQEPDHADAQANKALAEQLLQQQEQQQQGEQGDNQDPQDQDGQQAEQDGEQGKEGQESDDQNGESQTDGDSSQADGNPQEYGDETADADHQEEAESEQQSAQQQEQQDETDEQRAQAESQGEEDADERQEQASASTELAEGDREQRQALEQWLRKVPDDPAGLIRNKMQYEFRQRRQSGQSPGRGNNSGQRW